MSRTVLAVFRFTVDDTTTDEQVSSVLSDAWVQLEEAVTRDEHGGQYDLPTYELTVNYVVGPAA